MRWTKNLILVDSLVIETLVWTLYFVTRKLFRLHAISQDAAGAVRSYSGEGPGYCYMIGRGPNSCLLGHVTGLLICLYVKLFLPSIFQICRILKQYVFDCSRYRPNWEKHI